jgi:hypothetical protein
MIGCGSFYVNGFLCLLRVLVDDREIYAFEIYRPGLRRVWGKEIALDILWVSGKSFVAYLNRRYQLVRSTLKRKFEAAYCHGQREVDGPM